MKKIYLIAFTLLLLPQVSFAQIFIRSQGLSDIRDVNSLTVRLLGIGDLVIYFLVALAVIFIVWNVVIYIIKGSNPEEKTKSGLNILWGIIGLFVIVSLWGLVNILVNTFYTDPNIPTNRFPSANFFGNSSSVQQSGTTNGGVIPPAFTPADNGDNEGNPRWQHYKDSNDNIQ